MKGTLFLLPVFLSAEAGVETLCAWEISLIKNLKYYFVENEKSARRFLRKAGFTGSFDDIVLHHCDKDTPKAEQKKLLDVLHKGHDVGVLSEAGCPAIADPGAQITSLAHEAGISVVPVPGPSAILLTLMASGMNGQQFSFNGYLPVDRAARSKAIREFEQEAIRSGYTQLFIETPYRNNALMEEFLTSCLPKTRICVGVNISQPDGWIKTLPVYLWQKEIPDLHKKPAVFALSK